jgi:hypothetical protein
VPTVPLLWARTTRSCLARPLDFFTIEPFTRRENLGLQSGFMKATPAGDGLEDIVVCVPRDDPLVTASHTTSICHDLYLCRLSYSSARRCNASLHRGVKHDRLHPAISLHLKLWTPCEQQTAPHTACTSLRNHTGGTGAGLAGTPIPLGTGVGDAPPPRTGTPLRPL